MTSMYILHDPHMSSGGGSRDCMQKSHLDGGHPQLVSSPALRDLREVVHQPFKYVSSIQVTVVVHINVDHTLGVYQKRQTETQGQKTQGERWREQGDLR